MSKTEADPALEALIERSSELKHDLVEFACSPKMQRHLSRFMEQAVLEYGLMEEGEAADTVDRFVLQHRLPNGKSVLDLFLSARPDLSDEDRAMLRSWGDPVDGVYEVQSKDGEGVLLLNLIDDLEYRAYSNMGAAAFRKIPKGGFVYARLVPVPPIDGAWLVSGYMSVFPKSSAADVAQVALQAAMEAPEMVYRNPEKLQQSWEMMQNQRAAFIEFFGRDEVVLSPAEARQRLRGYYRKLHRAAAADHPKHGRQREIPEEGMPGLEFPDEMNDAESVGVIYDSIDGLNFYTDFAMLHELYADPALAADKMYADILREYLAADTVAPLPFNRLAAAYPDTVDAVFRRVLRKQNFTWTEHGEALMRRRKPWYYRQDPRPGVSVVGARLSELLAR
jgi:hypothetical protein